MINPDNVDKLISDIQRKEQEFVQHIKDFNKTVSEFARSSEKYPALRSLILDCHFEIEKLFDDIIEACFVNPLSDRKESLRDIVLSKVSFEAKKEILIALMDMPNHIINFIEKLNSLRNAFAHGYDIKHRKFKYDGEKYIFDQDGCYNFILDYAKVSEHLVDCYVKTSRDSTRVITEYHNIMKELGDALMKSENISKEELQKFIDSKKEHNKKSK